MIDEDVVRYSLSDLLLARDREDIAEALDECALVLEDGACSADDAGDIVRRRVLETDARLHRTAARALRAEVLLASGRLTVAAFRYGCAMAVLGSAPWLVSQAGGWAVLAWIPAALIAWADAGRIGAIGARLAGRR